MIGLIKVILSFNFIIGAIIGGTAVFLFRPLIINGINKVLKKND